MVEDGEAPTAAAAETTTPTWPQPAASLSPASTTAELSGRPPREPNKGRTAASPAAVLVALLRVVVSVEKYE
jgi:hypothetical protein